MSERKCDSCIHSHVCEEHIHDVWNTFDNCHSYDAERPRGEWIPINIHAETWDYKCSVCGAEVDIDFPNCPYCLADMRPKEGDEKKSCLNCGSSECELGNRERYGFCGNWTMKEGGVE